MIRLSKILANRGIASRRRCEELIEAGRVRVNGKVITKQGVRVDSEKDRITVDGQIVREVHKVYILLNKPVGYVSTAKDQRGRPTVLDLVSIDQRVFPVGRLDMNSEGLLLLTNDGAIADRLTHPRYEHEREYWVLLDGEDMGEAMASLQKGVQLEDGRAQAAYSSLLRPRVVRRQLLRGDMENDHTLGRWLRIVIREGRKRQIRRMCEAVGHSVQRLIRVRMGPLYLGALAAGTWRHLTEEEVDTLQKAVGTH